MGLLNAVLGREDPPEEVIGNCKAQIGLLLHDSDLKQGEDWIETDDGYKFRQGSAEIDVDFIVIDGIPYVDFLSPIVKLPSDNLLPFYRRLLELNFDAGGQIAIGVHYDTVCIHAMRTIEGLTEEGLEEVMAVVGGAADDLDDYLHEEFGAPFFDPEEQ